MILPPLPDNTHLTLEATPGTSVLIIGANGAGKSRFTTWLTNDQRDTSVRVSALDAIYDTRQHDTLPGSIDVLYNQEASLMFTEAGTASTRFERLMALLLRQEVLALIAYKALLARDAEAQLAPTPLDAVMRLWQELFPENRILLENGKLLFSRVEDDDTYSSVRLSDGEKAVLYDIGAVVMAPQGATIFVDSPTALLHSSISTLLWNKLENERPDCTFIYTTHDLDFASGLTNCQTIWVKSYDPSQGTWDYALLESMPALPDEIYMAIVGTRKPVLFIEGEDKRSIDAKLYPYIFPSYNVKALGSCNKVIESVRAFNDLNAMHHLDSYGIVDRDRRDAVEVKYLNGKKILVPDVAEVENILMLEDVIRTIAKSRGKDPDRVFDKVKRQIIEAFRQELHQQALLHTRHRVKRTLEYRVDGRFRNISGLEEHMHTLVDEIDPRGMYEAFCREFQGYIRDNDYGAILRVFNRKTMISSSNVASLCGIAGGKDGWVAAVIGTLRHGGKNARIIRRAVRVCFGIDPQADKIQWLE